MKKLINGCHIDIQPYIHFITEYLYGKELNKITLSNINNKIDLNPKITKIIDKYKQIYDNMHPIMQVMETDSKYCLMGEELGINYFVKNRALHIPLGSILLTFKSNVWSVNSYNENSGIVWKDCSKLLDYNIYKVYKQNPKNFIKNFIPELYEICDNNEMKVMSELNTILNFMTCDKVNLQKNTIIDLDLNIKYNIITSIKNSNNNLNKRTKVIIDLNENTEKTEQCSNKQYTYSIYKQKAVDLAKNEKNYGKEEKEENIFNDLLFVLNKNNVESTRGIKINNCVFFEVNNDIYISRNGESIKIIKGGKLYGYAFKNILISHIKELDFNLKKETIYLYKNDALDIAQVNIIKE